MTTQGLAGCDRFGNEHARVTGGGGGGGKSLGCAGRGGRVTTSRGQGVHFSPLRRGGDKTG